MALIPRTDLDVFPLNLGGNPFGWTADTAASEAILDAFAAAGGNFVDTADTYSSWVAGNAGGESETIIGDWMASRGNRDSVVIATKVGKLPGHQGLARANVTAALDASLRRLRTDRIDLYYFHADDPSVSIEEQVATASALVESGKARALALSNYSPARLRAFCTAASGTPGMPVALQPRYHLLDRHDFENHCLPLAGEFGLATFPYSTLASSFLTGKYRTDADAPGRLRGAPARAYLTERGLRVLDAVAAVAAEAGCSMTTVALAWLLTKGVTAPIASVSRPEQLADLMAAPALHLTVGQLAALDEASDA